MNITKFTVKRVLSNPLVLLEIIDVFENEEKFPNIIDIYKKTKSLLIDLTNGMNSEIDDILLNAGVEESDIQRICEDEDPSSKIKSLSTLVLRLSDDILNEMQTIIIDFIHKGTLSPDSIVPFMTLPIELKKTYGVIINKELKSLSNILSEDSLNSIAVSLDKILTGIGNIFLNLDNTIKNIDKQVEGKEMGKFSKKKKNTKGQAAETTKENDAEVVETDKKSVDKEADEEMEESIIKLNAKENEPVDVELIYNVKGQDRMVEELRESVNQLDSEMDDTLDEKLRECDMTMEEKISVTRCYLYSIVLKLNGISVPIEDLVMAGKSIDFSDEEFRNTTLLFNDKVIQKRIDPNSKTYRLRYLSLLLTSVSDSLDLIVNSLIDNPYDNEIDESKIFADFVKNIVTLSIRIIRGKNVDKDIESLMMILWMVNPFSKTEKTKKVVSTFLDARNVISNKNRVVVNDEESETESEELVYLSDEYVADYICKLAFISVTETDKQPKGVKISVPEEFTFANKEKVQELVESLGEALLTFKRETGNISIGYQMFSKSKPQLFFGFKEVNDIPELNAGCFALSYLAFITNDKYVKKAVKKLCVA